MKTLTDNLNWLPWQRYLLILTDTDSNKVISSGRFRLKKSAEKQLDRLSRFKGYKVQIVDTKQVITSRHIQARGLKRIIDTKQIKTNMRRENHDSRAKGHICVHRIGAI